MTKKRIFDLMIVIALIMIFVIDYVFGTAFMLLWSFALLLVLWRFQIRNNNVHGFLCYYYGLYHQRLDEYIEQNGSDDKQLEKIKSYHLEFAPNVTYDKMLFSLKRLTPDNWFSKELVEFLNDK